MYIQYKALEDSIRSDDMSVQWDHSSALFYLNYSQTYDNAKISLSTLISRNKPEHVLKMAWKRKHK